MMHNKTLCLTILAAALAASGIPAMAQDTTPPREQRMDEALQNYRGAAAKNPQPGPAARAEESIKSGARRAGEATKHGAQRAGQAVKHGAQRTGQAVGKGVEKTGEVIQRGGEKLKDASSN